MVSAYSIPQSKRDLEAAKNVPGPGSYEVREKVDGARLADPKYSIGKARRDDQPTRQDEPGPGNYDHDEFKVKPRAPAYSIKGRLQSRDAGGGEKNVGPGLYNPKYDFTQEQSPQFSLPRNQQRGDFNKQSLLVPGPGSYGTSGVDYDGSKSRIIRNVHFGTEERGKLGEATDVPGPGSYDLHLKNKPQAPKVKMGGRFDVSDKQSALVPGPGAYQPKASPFSRVGGLISKLGSVEGSMGSEPLPGPGAYNANYVLGRKNDGLVKFGKESRTQSHGNLLTPGPGNYAIDRIGSIGSFKANAAKFGSGQRDNALNHSEGLPGPGQYYRENFDSLNVRNMGGIAITKEKRITDQAHQVPGPGAYNPRHEVVMASQGGVKISSVKSLFAAQSGKGVPGPGAYNYYLRGGRGGVSFGKDARLRDEKRDGPGPGQYDHKIHFADVPRYLLPNGPTKSVQMGVR